jgi:glyoxylase-like metal-dependent hydrolase (beta-lactamase superfamily II)
MEIKRLILGPLLTNCYILISKEEAVVIDPGGESKKILEEIKDRKLKYIILTHSHLDHIFSAVKLKEKTGAKILIHINEKESLKIEANEFLEEGDEIKIGEESLKVILTPGHTKGSISLLGKDFIFTGDTLFKDGYGRTDLPGGSPEEMERSLKKLSELMKPGMKIYPGHGDIFKL